MKTTLIVIMTLLTLNIVGYSLQDTNNGNIVSTVDARTLSMGTSGIAESYSLFSSKLNPANLSFLNNRVGFQTSTILNRTHEKRSLPMYNSFDAYSGDAVYVANDNLFDNYATGIHFKHSFNDLSFAAAVSYSPAISFDALYEEEIRNNENSNYNNYPPILASNKIESEGTVNSLDIMYSLSDDKISVGFLVSTLTGDVNFQRSIIWSDTAREKIGDDSVLRDTINTMKRKISGTQVIFGAAYKANNRLSLGMSITPSVSLSVTGEADGVSLDIVVILYNSAIDTTGTA
ncbi:MAG: hypothetical protein PHR06_14155 [Candidatus Cloacimonetes bacterium]|nr:hypothetical protein [Candidatus Cloacimonadota bacterium]